MSAGQYIAGLALFVVIVGSACFAAWAIQRRCLPWLAGVPRVLAISTLATLALIAAHLAPGAIGVLSRGSVACAAALLALVAWRACAPGRQPRKPERPPEAPSSFRISWILAAVGVGGLAIFVIGSVLGRGATPAGNIDALTFHLPGVARWIQSGTFWQIDQFVPGLSFGQYPQNGDVLLMAAILPWENDAFVRLVNYVYLALTGLAVYAIGRELRAPRPTAALFGAVAVSIPAVSEPATVILMTDAPFLASFGTGLLFLLRHFRNERTPELVLAGLGLGLAFGTKWYGVSSVIVVLAVWAAASLIARRAPRVIARHGGALVVLVLLAGGFWLLRNLVEVGNPVYPLEVAPLGLTIFDAPPDPVREQAGFTIADYLGQPDVWSEYIFPAFSKTLAPPALLLGLGLALAIAWVLADRRRGRRLEGSVIAGIAMAVLLTAAYAITPYSALGPEGEPLLVGANTRYLVPALLVAAPLGAWAVGRLGRWRVVAELAAVVAIADGIRRSFDDVVAPAALTALVVGAVVATGLALARRHGVSRAAFSRPARLAVVAAFAALTVVIGYEGQRRFNDGRYLGIEPAFDVVLSEAPSGRRIGVAGEWTVTGYAPIWPMFGPEMGNEVEFVGPPREGRLYEYRDRDSFRAALRRDRYDFLVIGLADSPTDTPPEERWAHSAGYRQVTRSDRLALYERREPPETARLQSASIG